MELKLSENGKTSLARDLYICLKKQALQKLKNIYSISWSTFTYRFLSLNLVRISNLEFEFMHKMRATEGA
jgi:hypothetical protein